MRPIKNWLLGRAFKHITVAYARRGEGFIGVPLTFHCRKITLGKMVYSNLLKLKFKNKIKPVITEHVYSRILYKTENVDNATEKYTMILYLL